jgi:hypothetical protein
MMMFFLSGIPSAEAGVMDHWVTNKVSTNHIGLTFVVYGGGRYVAYGQYSDYGAVMVSTDGINWELRHDGGPSGDLSYSVALSYAGGKYFALGGFGTSGVSSDGFTWNTFSFPIANGVAYNGTTYVAAVNDPYTFPPIFGVFTSIDGLNWGHPLSFNASVGDICYGAGRFVAIGRYNGLTNNSGHIYTSSFGTNWVERPILGGRHISFCGGLFFVPYGAGTNLISANGIDWATVNTGITNLLGNVCYSHGVYQALAGTDSCECYYSYFAASTNGTNWFQYSKPLPKSATGLATDGNRLVTVGSQFIDTSHSDGFVYYLDPTVTLDISNGPPVQVSISGLIGRSHRIESAAAITNSTTNYWQTNLTLVLPSDPYVWTDGTAPGVPQRFYRAVLLP